VVSVLQLLKTRTVVQKRPVGRKVRERAAKEHATAEKYDETDHEDDEHKIGNF
jgi:hypothetical protein